MGAKTRLQEFERALKACNNEGIGNALHDSLVKTCVDLDGGDFAAAVLKLDMSELAPYLLTWRKHLIQEINAELDGGPDRAVYVTQRCREVEL